MPRRAARLTLASSEWCTIFSARPGIMAESLSARARSYSSASRPFLMMTWAPCAPGTPEASMCSSTTGAEVSRRLIPPSRYQLRDVSPSSTSEPPSALMRAPRARTRSASA